MMETLQALVEARQVRNNTNTRFCLSRRRQIERRRNRGFLKLFASNKDRFCKSAFDHQCKRRADLSRCSYVKPPDIGVAL